LALKKGGSLPGGHPGAGSCLRLPLPSAGASPGRNLMVSKSNNGKVFSEMSRESEMAERKEMELFGLLNEIIAKGGLPPSARNKLRNKRAVKNS
jgi:hypothetical protein